MRHFVWILFVALTLGACTSGSQDGVEDEASFVTMLGNDTLAVEQFVKTDSSITAQVVLRVPETSFSAYKLTLDETGGIEEMVKTVYPPVEGFTGSGAVTRTVNRVGDSLYVEVMEENNPGTYTAPYEPGVLPFIDMVHWPFEVAFNNAVETGQDTVIQPLLTGNRLSDFTIADLEGDSMTIRHPFRGVMGVNVDDSGNLEYLDAGLTTRKLKVYRHESLPIDDIGMRFAEQDRAGNSFGSLSGFVEVEYDIGDTNFQLEYGSPQKRDRELFGGIVPWGEVWRTGANRATHFSTTSDLQFGDLEVPAGDYTLFTIPEEDGGTLIINEETGQNGTAYDESMDLGRVPMEISTKEESTEAFTITVVETDNGGELQLIWGETVFSAPFTIE
ncbi:DUF2911 domain-containing protein [Gracilimonas mengyeensis]|uniref:DUF2911 domain-containing protein n=1 Tax=Gracilimonas mengyeensis TaxID=1302730 RepID=A0A521CFW8_9BACT|nr:DUF2911 domain-containing protein [Gracilimonas mengyeensis]SMO58337.1 Protein of unknown function [Gracilimonas mengyeensis]